MENLNFQSGDKFNDVLKQLRFIFVILQRARADLQGNAYFLKMYLFPHPLTSKLTNAASRAAIAARPEVFLEVPAQSALDNS